MVFSRDMSGNGGAAYIIGTLDLAITSTSFEANQAEQEGMAVFLALRSEASRVNFTNVSFAKNAYRCPLGQ